MRRTTNFLCSRIGLPCNPKPSRRTLLKESQLVFGNSKLREATIQTDQKSLEHHHDGFVQTFESGTVYGHFTAKFTLVLGIALLTGHGLLAALFSFQPDYVVDEHRSSFSPPLEDSCSTRSCNPSTEGLSFYRYSIRSDIISDAGRPLVVRRMPGYIRVVEFHFLDNV